MTVVAQTDGSTFAETGTTYKVQWVLMTAISWWLFPHREILVKDLKLSNGYLWKHKNSLGTAFVCPKCAEVWGKITLTLKDVEQEYRIWPRSCKEHGDGSLRAPLDGTDRDINNMMPLEVLIRELDLAVKPPGGSDGNRTRI